MKIKNLNNSLIIGYWLLIISIVCFPKKIIAQTFTSPSYRIDWGNFNITSGKKTSSNYQLTDTVGQLAPGQYTSTTYTLKSGFQYIYDSFKNFSFSISSYQIALGTLVPDIGSTATNTFTISSPYGTGYEILAHENRPLTQQTGITLPDTSCNVGSTCTEIVTGTWTSSTAYGFGFNTIGIDSNSNPTGIGTSNYFPTGDSYRQFANYAASPPETSQVIMSENASVQSRMARVTYKANISSLQAAGNYENAVVFTAVPKY